MEEKEEMKPFVEQSSDKRTTPRETEDDSPSVLSLRNLLRHNKINKSQYVGGLATLVATGLISKQEFTRLKAAAN